MTDKTLFARQPEKRDFLKNASRRKSGDMLFAKMEKPVEFFIPAWEWYTPQGGKEQIALVLAIPDGREFIWPLGTEASERIAELDFEGPDDVEKKFITIEAYETGSADEFAVGKRIVAIYDDATLDEWTSQAE